MNASDNTTNPPLKRCTKCGCEYPATAEYFYTDKHWNGHLRADCKTCNKARRAEYYAQHTEEQKARVTQYYREHIETEKARRAAYQRSHPEISKKSGAKWERKHPEKRRLYSMRRRAAKRKVGGTHTTDDILAQLKRQKKRCYYCGEKLDGAYHVEHVIPLSRGGSDSPDNLVIACPACNFSKGDKLPHEWPKGGRLL